MNLELSALLSSARDAVRSRLWPLPTAALVVALVGGFLVPHLDAAYDDDLPSWLGNLVFTGDAGAARTVLDAVSSSLITVTSLTFSLTVVTLQLASSQFSPRLLRTFSSDVFVQATLAVFLSTFLFSLTALRTVRSGEEGGDPEFVPRIAVTLGFVMAIVSVFMLVAFLGHLAREIRVETMLRNVHRDASATIAASLPERERSLAERMGDIPEPGIVDVVVAPRSGFLTRFDDGRLIEAAVAADAIVHLDAHPGSFVVQRVPFARVWRRDGGRLSEAERHELVTEVMASTSTDYERTAGQDISLGLRQLTDVTNKALSPGINDPTTAVHALGHISALLCELADRELGPRALRDDDDQVRVVRAGPDFAALVEEAITQPRRYGESDPQVLAQLFRLLGDLACRVPEDERSVVGHHLERLEATAAAQAFDDAEQGMLLRLGEQVRADLVQPPTTPPEEP